MSEADAPPGRGLAAFLALLFLFGLFLRLPVVGLPVDGESAGLATRAGEMAAERSFGLEAVRHRGPLLPMLLAVPIAAGATPTGALRVVDVLLGALLAPLGAAVALRLGLGRRVARWGGVLLAAHPTLALGAGGVLAGTGALATVLLLGALLLSTRRRRAGLVPLLLLPLAEPACAVYLPFLVFLALRHETSRRAGVLVVAAATLALLLTPWPVQGGDAPSVLAVLVQWLPLACLAVLLPFAPLGVAAWIRSAGETGIVLRAWTAGALLHGAVLLLVPGEAGFAFGWRGAAAGTPLVPLVVLAGLVGLGRLAARRRDQAARVALGLGLAASLLFVIGPAQTELFPDRTPPAGRLWRLGRVVREAGEAAGPGGWVALDLSRDLGPYELARLADLVPRHRTGRLPRHADEETGPLAVLPLESLRGDLGIVTRHRPQVLDVVTFGGRGIYRQEPVLRIGPWLVLRASRP